MQTASGEGDAELLSTRLRAPSHPMRVISATVAGGRPAGSTTPRIPGEARALGEPLVAATTGNSHFGLLPAPGERGRSFSVEVGYNTDRLH